MCQMSFLISRKVAEPHCAQSDAISLDIQLVTALLRGMLNAAIEHVQVTLVLCRSRPYLSGAAA